MRVSAVAVLVAVVLATGAAALAQDEQPILLRYKWLPEQRLTWELASRVNGRISIVEGEGAGTTLDANTIVNMSIFCDVLGVEQDGSARVKMSFGAMSVVTTLPTGQTFNVLVDLAAGKLRIQGVEGAQPLEQDLPPPLGRFFSQGLTVLITDRGKVTSVEGGEELQALFAKMAGPQASVFNLADAISWIEPLLPEQPVKTGDTWSETRPFIFGATGPGGAPNPFVINYAHAGYTNIEGVRCVKINSNMSLSGVDFATPEPDAAQGLKQEFKEVSIQVNLSSNLSCEDTHVLSLDGQITQTGTVHQEGTVTFGDRQMPLNQTYHMDRMQVSLQASRVP